MTLSRPLAHTSTGLTPLGRLSHRYDGVLCDIWGVLHNGTAAFAAAVEALCRVRSAGGIVILITNAPRLSKDVLPQLQRLGVPAAAFDGLITSGDVTSSLIASCPDVPLFHFGPARDASLLEGLRNPMVSLPDAGLCLLTGPLDDDIASVDVYENRLVTLRDKAVEMICANPDLVVHSGGRTVICAGSIARRYAQIGGRVTYSGKPEAAIYDAAMRMAADRTGRPVPKRRLLAIGDGLATDMAGAARNGFDALFITQGIETATYGAVQTPAEVRAARDAITRQHERLRLVGICDRLRWD